MWSHLKRWDKKQGRGCIADGVDLNRRKGWEMARGGAAAALANKKNRLRTILSLGMSKRALAGKEVLSFKNQC